MDILKAAKSMSIVHNVSFRVLDATTGKVVREYSGHNQATNSMLLGIAHYLKGDGVLNQGTAMLSSFVPKYISLGTMGLKSQEEDDSGLPVGLIADYAISKPGYGADGYDAAENNGRPYFGLGPVFADRGNKSKTVDCELISDSFPRAPITYRQIVPETQAEYAETIDIIFSAMISTGALAQFREEGKDYIFITEAGLWSKKAHSDDYPNGLLAGYRLLPPDEKDRDNPDEQKKHILRVNKNQVVQVIWKVQLGSKEIFGSNSNQCDCICKDKTNPDPNCPCHGNKSTVTPSPPIGILTMNLTGCHAGIGILNILPDDPDPTPEPTPNPEPAYDETKIALIELDENDVPTGCVSYFLSFSDASSYLADNAQTNYDMRVGNEVDVNTIPAETFQALTNLHHVTLSDRITRIGGWAFNKCTGLKEVYAPGVKVIERYCFIHCTSLTHIDTPNLTEIQTYAFYHCESLDDVSMGTLIVAIPVYAFGYCYNLKTIELGPVPSILGQAFYGCSSLESISLPNQLLSIGNQAFYECESLTSITLPNTVTSIGISAFYGCRSLESITLSSTLTSIGNQAFQGCSSLTSITLPNTVTSIGISAFYGCSSLESITIPNSITAIQENTFYGCSSLVSVTFPSALNTIQNYAFIACGGLTSISLPNTLTFIGASAFSFSYSLKTITITKPENSISGAPWGATNATVTWTG